MTVITVLVTIAALALFFILRIALVGNPLGRSGPDVSEHIQPIDLEAFRNLVDPTEDDYLRRCMPLSDFRRVQRERLLAVAAYVKIAAKNAAVLASVGQNVLAAADPSTVEAARQLVERALSVRRNSALALIRIYLQFVWPRSGFAAAPILSAYERLNGAASLFDRLQNPARPIRITAS